MGRKREPKVRLVMENHGKDGWMVFREDDRDRHGHFHRHADALMVMECIRKGLLPVSEFFRESCRRLLTPEEYEGLSPKHEKQAYFNPQKGGVR